MSSKEIWDLYHQVYALKRLPRPPPCGPERAQEIMKDIMSSLKDCLRWRKGEQMGGDGEPESATTLLSCHCNWASQRGRWDTSEEWELTEAREAHQWALAAAATLEECIERLSQSTTRMWLDTCHHFKSQDQPRRRSWGWSYRCSRALPGEGHQSQSPKVWLAPIDRSLSWTQDWHWKKNRHLGRPPLFWGLCWSWGQTLSASCRGQSSCKERAEGAIFLKDPQQKTTKIGSSGGDVELTHQIGGRS